jgi:DNA topoisomerase IA
MSKLIIAEKPSVALTLAEALGAKEKKEGCYLGNGWIISWCVGHLVELAPASAYDEKLRPSVSGSGTRRKRPSEFAPPVTASPPR